MKRLLFIVFSVLVVLGLGYYVFHDGPTPVGNLYEPEASHFVNGFYVGSSDQLSISDAGALSSSAGVTTTGTLTGGTLSLSGTANSSSSPAALGAAVTGHMIIASAATTGNASSTAVTADSKIFLQQEFTSPIAGTTCKSTSATTTPAVATKVAGNGFTVSLGGTVTGNTCLAFWVLP